MTTPKIELVSGSRDTECIILLCTGCDETFNYSVRQYKGDFGCNLSEFESFLQWAKWEAAKHECFLAGRIGYIEDPRDVTPDDPLAYHVDFPQEDMEKLAADGGVGYIVEPEQIDALAEWLQGEDYWPPLDDDDDDDPYEFAPDCPTCGAHPQIFVDGDCPKCNPPIEDDEDPFGEEAMRARRETFEHTFPGSLDFRRLYEMGPPRYSALSADEAQAILLNYVHGDDSDNYDWDEVRFDFLYGEPTEFKTYGSIAAEGSVLSPDGITITGRFRREPPMQPRPAETPRLRSFPPITFDYREIEQRVVDEWLLREGVYSLDDHGCLRDEKGRCLACIRPGPHFPFYYERDKR